VDRNGEHTLYAVTDKLPEVKELVLKESVSLVVISGYAGSGKTTLSKMLCKDDTVQGIYGKNTIFVTVSETPNIKDIFQNIFKHKGGTPPPFQNEESAMNHIENLMRLLVVKGGPILLVLDDVWSGCESLIEKFRFKIDKYKILVTSRSEFPRFKHTCKLGKLAHEDAVKLFRHSALREDDASRIPDEIVNEIVKGCYGSPLALTVVGKSLKGQPEVRWKITQKKLSKGQSVFHLNKKDLLLPLKTSLDALDEIALAKDFFLDIGSFPEDTTIPAADLLDMFVELYDLDHDGLEALDTLVELSTRNFVNLLPKSNHVGKSNIKVVVDECGSEYNVKQHDLLRELAKYESSQESFEQTKRLLIEIKANSYPKWWHDQQRQLLRAHILSISTDETFDSIWCNAQLPSAEVLLLNFCSSDYSLPPFISTMHKLKFLIISNRGRSKVALNDIKLLDNLSKLKRIRLEYVSITSLTTSILQSKNLRKISLMMCEISKALATCPLQTPDILPNIADLELDYCDDLTEFPVAFCNLSRLKKLSITYCNELISFPDEFGRLANLETLRIHSCTMLEELPESISGLHKLIFLDISDCVSIRRMPDHIGKLKNLKALDMRGCYFQDLPTSVEELRELKHVICEDDISYLWEYYADQLADLEISVIKEEVNLDWLHNV
jgi:hypothetical protein